LQGDTEESPNEDDQSKYRHTSQRGLDRDCSYDVASYQEFETQYDRTAQLLTQRTVTGGVLKRLVNDHEPAARQDAAHCDHGDTDQLEAHYDQFDCCVRRI